MGVPTLFISPSRSLQTGEPAALALAGIEKGGVNPRNTTRTATVGGRFFCRML
jgi:hypothetical protein